MNVHYENQTLDNLYKRDWHVILKTFDLSIKNSTFVIKILLPECSKNKHFFF